MSQTAQWTLFIVGGIFAGAIIALFIQVNKLNNKLK